MKVGDRMQFTVGIIIGLSIGVAIAVFTVLSYGAYIRNRNLKKTYILKCREYGPAGELIGEFTKVVTSCMSSYEAREILMVVLTPYIEEGRKFIIDDVREMAEYEVV